MPVGSMSSCLRGDRCRQDLRLFRSSSSTRTPNARRPFYDHLLIKAVKEAASRQAGRLQSALLRAAPMVVAAGSLSPPPTRTARTVMRAASTPLRPRGPHHRSADALKSAASTLAQTPAFPSRESMQWTSSGLIKRPVVQPDCHVPGGFVHGLMMGVRIEAGPRIECSVIGQPEKRRRQSAEQRRALWK